MQHFIENPNLPLGKVSVAAIGAAYVDELSAALRPYGVKLLSCPNNPYVDARLGSHIDLSFFHIGENRFLLSKAASESAFAEELKNIGAEIIVSESKFSNVYPNDAILCALSLGGKVFHNTKLTDANIKSAFVGKLLHVNQGYSKCAVCAVTENAAISSDTGLAKVMREQGIEVLEIAAGFIALEGFGEGLIGGSAFKLASDTLAFTGNLEMHSDRTKIENFLLKYSVSPVYLTGKPIFDIGSVIPILEI